MISKNEAISIAKRQMPETGFSVENVTFNKNVYYVALKKGKQRYQVDIDANTGRVIGGAGGAP